MHLCKSKEHIQLIHTLIEETIHVDTHRLLITRKLLFQLLHNIVGIEVGEQCVGVEERLSKLGAFERVGHRLSNRALIDQIHQGCGRATEHVPSQFAGNDVSRNDFEHVPELVQSFVKLCEFSLGELDLTSMLQI